MVKKSKAKKNKDTDEKKPAIKTREKRSKGKAAASTLKMLTRQTWALDLKRQGLSYRRIAARLKELNIAKESYSSGLAYRDVDEAMTRMLVEQKEIAEHNLQLDLQRIEELLMVSYPLAVPQGENALRPPDFQAIGVVMMLIDRRERLLNYKALWKEPDKPQWNINVDWSKLSTGQIMEIRRRISSGEEPIVVFSEIQAQEADSTDGKSSD